jgi:hypothetical protein
VGAAGIEQDNSVSKGGINTWCGNSLATFRTSNIFLLLLNIFFHIAKIWTYVLLDNYIVRGENMMKKNKIRQKKTQSLEDMYKEIIKISTSHLTRNDTEETLEQPHLFRFVDSVTTYGAYQEPI